MERAVLQCCCVLMFACAKPAAPDVQKNDAPARVMAERPIAEQARQRALAKVQARHGEARSKSNDPYWNSSTGNAQRWAAAGFSVALEHLRQKPDEGESAEAYVKRISAAVRADRGNGPDGDDEGWFDGAIDDAAGLISRAAEAP
ncbi:MAG: hypothetical protein JNK82_28600 [Myxococcaceae bacterium]|nr:hypothetical protein [Myxococcaceae bacterium]